MMNHCNELSLSKFMSHKECLSPATVLQICRDLAKALDFLHEVDLYSNLLTPNLNSIKNMEVVFINIFLELRVSTEKFDLKVKLFEFLYRKFITITIPEK